MRQESDDRRIVFDIGTYDGLDTQYYLQMGFTVIAVEANPALILKISQAYETDIRAGRLTLENCAIARAPGTITLHICKEDPGSSSLYQTRLSRRTILETRVVPAIPITELFQRYGVPYYMKVDIEGADRFCILPLTRQTAPNYVSFEIGQDADELLEHLKSIGYSRFKTICQESFRELENVNCFRDRFARRVRQSFGFPESRTVRRGHHVFTREHSSGPMPEYSDGRWRSFEETLDRWARNKQHPRSGGWYDLHASLR